MEKRAALSKNNRKNSKKERERGVNADLNGKSEPVLVQPEQ